MLSIRQTFRKGPLPLLISCGLEKLGLLPAHPGLKKLQRTNNILSMLFRSHSAAPAPSFFQELSPHFSLRKQRKAYIQAPSLAARAHLPPPPRVLLFLLSSH